MIETRKLSSLDCFGRIWKLTVLSVQCQNSENSELPNASE